MRTLVLSLAISLTSVAALGLVGCDDKTPAAEGSAAERHLCPMHCVPEGQTEEVSSQGPSKCSVCGMDLVPESTLSGQQ